MTTINLCITRSFPGACEIGVNAERKKLNHPTTSFIYLIMNQYFFINKKVCIILDKLDNGEHCNVELPLTLDR